MGNAETPDPVSAPGTAEPGVPVAEADSGYTPSGVPTLEGVREKIETRYGTALGHTELAGQTPEARDADERYEATKKAAAERVEQIRAAMRDQGDPQSPDEGPDEKLNAPGGG